MKLSIPVKVIVLAVLALIVLACLFFFLSSGEQRMADLLQLVRWIDGQGLMGMVVMVGVIGLVSATGVIPASFFVAAAGSLYGLLPGMAVSFLGLLAGGVAGFVVSRHILRRPLSNRVARSLSLTRIDSEFARRGWKFVALFRLSPVFPFALVSYAMGVSSVRFRDFLVGLVGSMPSVLAFTYSGAMVGDFLTTYTEGGPGKNWVQFISLFLGLFATVLLLFFTIRFANRELRPEDLS